MLEIYQAGVKKDTEKPTDSLNGPAQSEMFTYQPLLGKFMYMKPTGNDISLN